MSENTLFTALHISDLHFGDTAQGDSIASLDARTPGFLARFPYLDGLLGHHYLGLQDLHRFYHDLLHDRDGRVAIVVSGDVTATGSVAQFDLAAEFLGARVPAGVFGIELGLADWARGAVSGNHDNWPGSIMVLGGPSAGLRQHFAKPFPIIGRLVGIGGGLSLRFILVDSDADVGSVSLDRLMARGEFSSQLLAVEQSLPGITQGEIRVMVVHHAVADASVPVQGTAAPFPRRLPRRPRILEVGTRTLGVMERVIVEGGIKVVMTGHMHVPRLTEMIAQERGVHATVLEARCGTTTQLDRYPTQVLAGMHRRRELPRNSLIVHEVLERDGQVVWRARIHNRSIGGFVPGPWREVVVLP